MTAQLPEIHPGKWEQLIYYLFELFCWSVWYRHRRSVHGNLPDEPLVLVANHGSYLDWLLLHVVLRRRLRRKVHFLAKAKLLRNPFFRVLIRATDSIVVEESRKTRAMVMATRLFADSPVGEKPVICIFPEGTRSRDGERLPAHNGAFWLARKSQVTLVPVALCGFWEAWPPAVPLPYLKRRQLRIHFLEPVKLADFPDDQTAAEFAMSRIYEVVCRERATGGAKK